MCNDSSHVRLPMSYSQVPVSSGPFTTPWIGRWPYLGLYSVRMHAVLLICLRRLTIAGEGFRRANGIPVRHELL